MKSQQGLTFLEIVAAALIMALGVVPLMRLAPAILQTTVGTEHLTECVFLATRVLEGTKGSVHDDYDRAGGFAQPATAFPQPDYAAYRFSVTDDDYQAPVPDIRTISVLVWHADEPGRAVALYTRIARR
jgi:Tfp pilus assembly protein PilV